VLIEELFMRFSLLTALVIGTASLAAAQNANWS